MNRRWNIRSRSYQSRTRPADLSAVLDLAEMGVPEGVVGEVIAIGPAPRIAEGRGRVVLTTVNHLNNFVFHLTLRNAQGVAETLGVTGYHKFYDQAQGWQSVVDLTVGDSLRGQDGQSLTVVDVTRDPGVQRVYNLTVESDHVYFVGDLTTLTHNTCTAVVTPSGVTLDVYSKVGGHHPMAAGAFRTGKGSYVAGYHPSSTLTLSNSELSKLTIVPHLGPSVPGSVTSYQRQAYQWWGNLRSLEEMRMIEYAALRQANVKRKIAREIVDAEYNRLKAAGVAPIRNPYQ